MIFYHRTVLLTTIDTGYRQLTRFKFSIYTPHFSKKQCMCPWCILSIFTCQGTSYTSEHWTEAVPVLLPRQGRPGDRPAAGAGREAIPH